MSYYNCPLMETMNWCKSIVLKTLPHVYSLQQMRLPRTAFPQHFPYSHWHSLHNVSTLLFLMLCHKGPKGERKETASDQEKMARARQNTYFTGTLFFMSPKFVQTFTASPHKACCPCPRKNVIQLDCLLTNNLKKRYIFSSMSHWNFCCYSWIPF